MSDVVKLGPPENLGEVTLDNVEKTVSGRHRSEEGKVRGLANCQV